MADEIKLDNVSLDAVVAEYATTFESTIAAMDDFANAASSSPYNTGNSAAASPLSSFMVGLTIDYLRPLKGSLSNLLITIPSAAAHLQEQDGALAHTWEGN